MIALFTSVLFVGAFFAAVATITLMLEAYGGRAMAALRMEHQPTGASLRSDTPYLRQREPRVIPTAIRREGAVNRAPAAA